MLDRVREDLDAQARDVDGALRQVEDDMAGRGRVLIRYSGTEPVARVMIEGEDERRVNEYAHDIAEELKRELGGS